MVSLKWTDLRVFDDALAMHQGYVLDFTNRSFADFFEDELGIDIYDEKYGHKGSSKAKHLRAFIETEDGFTVAKALRVLWRYRESLPHLNQVATYKSEALKRRYFKLVSIIEGAVPRTDALERFKSDQTLEELVAAIERDIGANKPAAALDRLHTYCMKKFAHLLDERGVTWDRNDPLHSRVGKYVKALEQEREVREITRRIVKSAISVFEQFNDVRNNESFAHDNDIIESAEARFIFDAVSAFLRFVKATETSSFGA